MVSQCWVIDGETALAAVSHQQDTSKDNMGVVLIPGFSQSMCDTDYFMARLARRLAGEGIYVLQADPRGHGDSPGCLEEVTLSMLRADIQSVVNYAAVQSGGAVMGIGRGLTATLMAELAPELPVAGVAGIHPYGLDPAAVKALIKNIGTGVIDTADILTGTDFSKFSDFNQDWLAFFDALGSGFPYNLIGQKISTDLFREMAVYEPNPILQASGARFWLIPDSNAPEGMDCRMPDGNGDGWEPYRSLRKYHENPFPSNTMWYHLAIEKICGWIVAKRGELNANTGTNRG